MKIHLLGHASLLVETTDCRILMDPVFWDPHFEGLADVHPKREVLTDALPEIDVLIVSHRHQDHFDVRTLASLPRDVGVLIPHDPTLDKTLKKLGFSQIRALRSAAEVTLGGTTLFTTRSHMNPHEFGVLVSDASGVFWNQIDSVVESKTIGTILSRFPPVDLMLAMWQPMLEINYQDHQSLAFPFSEYNRILYNLGLLAPRAIAPGANGFLYRGDAAWLNHVVFPMTRERFASDIKEVCPSVKDAVFIFEPGDVLTVEGGRVEHHPGACPFVRKLAAVTEPYDFSPVRLDGHFVDHNPDGYDVAEMHRAIEEEITARLPAFIAEHRMVFLDHRRWGVIYTIEVAFPDGRQRWTIDLTDEPVKAEPGASPLANLFVYMTASALFGILKGQKGWDHALLGAYYRKYQKIYKATPHGLVRPEHCTLGDPLAHKLNYEEVLDATLDHEIARWSTPARDT